MNRTRSVKMLFVSALIVAAYSRADHSSLTAKIAKIIKKHETKKNERLFKGQPALPPQVLSNVISGNGQNGIRITNFSSGNRIQNNSIGVSNDGAQPLGNRNDGVLIEYNSDNNMIGGLLGQNNTIAYNKKGVVIGHNPCDESINNSILSNSIFANKSIGIDLGNNGRTLNHSENPVPGPNNFQNYPCIDSAVCQDGSLKIAGILHSVPNSTFLIQFFSTRKKTLEGKTLLGNLTVLTDGAGSVSFITVVPSTGCKYLTSTATMFTAQGLPGNTSEFSYPREIKKYAHKK